MSVLADILNPAFAIDDAVRVILQSFKHGTIGKVFCCDLNLLVMMCVLIASLIFRS